MIFANPIETRNRWEEIEQGWNDRQKPQGLRFLGNNTLPKSLVDEILDDLGINLSDLNKISIHELNKEWGDRQNRNWVKIITFALSEYAYYNDSEGDFWQNLCIRLEISDSQGPKQNFRKILKQGFDLLGLIKPRGGYKYVSTLYLQSGIPQYSLPHFAELVDDIANNLGWWNIAHCYKEIDLAQTLYDFALERHSGKRTLEHFLEKCVIDNHNQKDVEPLSGQLLKYIATVALELERRQQNPSILKDKNSREKYLQGLSLPYNFFLRNWDNLASVLTPKPVPPTRPNQIIRQRKRELILRLDIQELNLQLVLPEQSLWRKEWKNLTNSACQIPQAKWKSNINYPNSLEIPELCDNLHTLSDHWTYQLKDANGCNLIEWHCEGVKDDFPLLIFDEETGNQIPLSPENLQISEISELVCYFPTNANLQTNSNIELTDAFFPCLIQNWQAKSIRLNGRSATFKLVGKDIDISVDWQVASSRKPVMRGLQIKSKKRIYLEAPQIYYPLGDSVEAIHIQIENMDRQEAITKPDEKIKVELNNGGWQKIKLNKWIEFTGDYQVRLWQGTSNWLEKFSIQPYYQVSQPLDSPQIEINSKTGHNILARLPIRCRSFSEFWSQEITIQGLWIFEPVIFILSNGSKQCTFTHHTQADREGKLHLSLMSLREDFPDGEHYVLDWLCRGDRQRLLKTI